MKNSARKRARQGLCLCATVAAALLVWLGFRLAPESTPVARGAAYAYLRDCIECHGQPGDALPKGSTLECAGQGFNPTHPLYEGECRDLLAYFEAVRLKRTFRTRANARIPNRLLQGERLARQYSCFQCHGELGQGGFRNPGALKGYIPGYFGDDFAILTRGGSAESIRAWISQGVDSALLERPIEGVAAEFFIERQAVSMPKFGSLPESEIRMLADYVIALNQFGEMDADRIRSYSWLTQQPLRTARDADVWRSIALDRL